MSKKCAYCTFNEDKHYHPSRFFGKFFDEPFERAMVEHTITDDIDDYVLWAFAGKATTCTFIEYCPWCGRKLGEN